MKTLILGGSGQLGISLLESDLKSTEVHSPSSSIIDVTDFDRTTKYILEMQPDVVINATAWTNVPGAEESKEATFLINSKAVGNMAFACKLSGAALVHISTDYVFDGRKGTSYSELDPPSPLNVYGDSKLAGENAIINSDLESFYIIRTSWLYSRFGKNFVKTIASKSIRCEPASVTDDQFGSPTFAGDLAEGILSILKTKPKPGIYNYSNSGVTSWFQFAQKIYQLTGSNESLVSSRETESSELKRPAYSPLDLSKWADSGLSQIRSWEERLIAELPDIIAEIEREKN